MPNTKAPPARFAIPVKYSSQHAKDLRARVLRALQEGDRHLVVDCEAWDRFDLSLLSSLIQCASACQQHGAEFEVANMSSDIRQNVRDLQLAGRLGLSE